jgi:hypothetical protein
MIQLLDEIVVEANSLSTLRALLHERYLPGALARNMQLAGEWVSPPVTVAGEPHTLWLSWQLQDIGAWWAMRQQAIAPDVEELWKEVDAVCLRRARHVQIPAGDTPATMLEAHDA